MVWYEKMYFFTIFRKVLGRGGEECTAYMRKLVDVKKIDVEIEIKVAHRNPTCDPNAETRENPRSIQVLGSTHDDRDKILEK